jgi:DNA-binding transcriptional ArsR family regulator
MARADDEAAPAQPVPVWYEVGQPGRVVAELLGSMLTLQPRPDHPVGDPHGRIEWPDELVQRASGFWDDGESCFTELVVLADRAGVLFESDFDRVRAGLEESAAELPRFQALDSETPEDQIRFHRRLERLHEEPDLRRRWLALLGDVWELVGPSVSGPGRPVLEGYAYELRARLARRTYADLDAIVNCDFHGTLPRLVQQYSSSGRPVVVTPAWLGFKAYVLSLPELLFITITAPGGPPGPTPETRERARRFKALADPTRLAILETTAFRPRTIGELAEAMSVAQPTVSNHVRILRDAGLLVQAEDGTRRLRAVPEALHRLAEESLTAIGAGPSSGITAIE